MKLLLTQTIDKIGIVGEVIDASEGYARNYLLPKKLAVQPTEGNIKRLEVAKLDYEKQVRELREQKEKLLEKLTGAEISVIRNANDEGHLFGSVSKRDIAEELVKLGFAIEPDDVKLEEPLRRIDTYKVAVALAGDLKTEIKVWIVRDKSEAAAAEKKAAAEADAVAEQAGTETEEEAPA
jgi:large subunit ribosomal protein L9